jgi:heme a synthase
LPPLSTHALIEFGNRVVSGIVGVITVVAAVLAFTRKPYRRDLAVLAVLLPIGVLAQAVLGGFTVREHLAPGFVMAHFGLSMIILIAAVALAWRSAHEPGSRPRSNDRLAVWSVRGLLPLGALTIFAGTAATAAGPHAGGSPGQKINRLSFDGRDTMDFVIHRHAEIAFVFSLLAVATWWLARRRRVADQLQRPLTVLCVLLALQGAVGIDQYETHLPTELVWVHVLLACGAWLAVLWAVCAAGRLAPRKASNAREMVLRAVRGPGAPINFPGN